MDTKEAEKLAQLSLGRIFRLMSRQYQEGDIEQYEQAKSTFLNCMDVLACTQTAYEPNWCRDRLRGAQGD